MASAELYMLGEPAKGQYHPIQGSGGGGGESNSPGCRMLQKPGEFRQKSHWVRGRVRLTVGL